MHPIHHESRATQPPRCLLRGDHKKQRSILSEEQAIQIFEMLTQGKKPNATRVARLFGVSDKAVRDIWIGRTWSHVTNAPKLTKGRDSTSPVPASASESSDEETMSPTRIQNAIGSIDDLLFEWSEHGLGLQAYDGYFVGNLWVATDHVCDSLTE
mmetsp:Transcript_45991/g.122042  ORF Transcript_45991/g.122042 Transcript_45991/m.122042 type:complete len:155 (-) Transcript_45991:25-489(-)